MGLLTPIENHEVLAYWLGTTPKHLVSCVRTMHKHVSSDAGDPPIDMGGEELDEKVIKKHRIRTQKGKVRTVYEADHSLRWLQDKIQKKILSTVHMPGYLHAFIGGRSPVTCAEPHVGCRVMMKIDFKDFFPSISIDRVFGIYAGLFGANKSVAWPLMRLTTHDGHLCQGFLTSPTLSNIAAFSIDRRVAGLARKNGFSYTRYCDDIVLSSHTHRGDVDYMKDAVYQIVSEEGFRVNNRKTCIRRPGRRMSVTGIVVNEKLTISRHHRRHIRWAVDGWPTLSASGRRRLRGHIAWLNMSRPEEAAAHNMKIAAFERGELVRTRLQATNNNALFKRGNKHVDGEAEHLPERLPEGGPSDGGDGGHGIGEELADPQHVPGGTSGT